MARQQKTDSKVQALRQSRTFNGRAQHVRDRLFLEEDFFDPRDLAQENFAQAGLAGLVPKKRGPKQRRKLNAQVMDFVARTQAQEPALNSAALARRIQEQFALRVHRRTLERALLAVKKKRP